jgi:hypothetical protein
MYPEKKVTAAELGGNARTGCKVCEHGEYINLKAVPMETCLEDLGMPKAMISLFFEAAPRRKAATR